MYRTDEVGGHLDSLQQMDALVTSEGPQEEDGGVDEIEVRPLLERFRIAAPYGPWLPTRGGVP